MATRKRPLAPETSAATALHIKWCDDFPRPINAESTRLQAIRRLQYDLELFSTFIARFPQTPFSQRLQLAHRRLGQHAIKSAMDWIASRSLPNPPAYCEETDTAELGDAIFGLIEFLRDSREPLLAPDQAWTAWHPVPDPLNPGLFLPGGAPGHTVTQTLKLSDPAPPPIETSSTRARVAQRLTYDRERFYSFIARHPDWEEEYQEKEQHRIAREAIRTTMAWLRARSLPNPLEFDPDEPIWGGTSQFGIILGDLEEFVRSLRDDSQASGDSPRVFLKPIDDPDVVDLAARLDAEKSKPRGKRRNRKAVILGFCGGDKAAYEKYRKAYEKYRKRLWRAKSRGQLSI